MNFGKAAKNKILNPGFQNNMRKAVIDLGTNTFHLLIADIEEGQIIPVHKEQIAVKLGEGGINENTIGAAAYERGQQALEIFRQHLDLHGLTNARVAATSAIRGASNGEEFIREAKERSGLIIQCISGLEEAEFIAIGVLNSLPPMETPFLIMDIGGGSVEFIICRDKKILHKESIDIGAARLLEKFHPSDPLLASELGLIRTYLEEKLSGLMHRCAHFGCHSLVGSAGSFESILDLIDERIGRKDTALNPQCFQIDLTDFDTIYHLLLSSTMEERKGMAGLADFRVEMMVLASILIDVVLKMGRMETLFCSLNSLKEGLMLAQE